MSLVIGTIYILFGQVRSCIEREILKKNFMEYWKEICVQFMILPEDRDMKYGFTKKVLFIQKRR